MRPRHACGVPAVRRLGLPGRPRAGATAARDPRTGRRSRPRILPALLLGWLWMGAAAAAPALPARTLGDRALLVPADLHDRASLLVVGYNRASRAQTASCLRRVADDPMLRGRLQAYQVVGLGSVPRPLRGAIVAGMRRDVPSAQHDRFLVIGEGQEAWQAATGHAEPDAAYLLLVDRGTIVWRDRGPCDAATLVALRSRALRASDASPVP